MEKSENIIRKVFPVPVIMLMDILKIVIKNKLPNSISAINVFDSTVWLNVSIPQAHPHSKEIIENIEVLLSDYGMFTHLSPNSTSEIENNFSV
jgi:hypothetical protein